MPVFRYKATSKDGAAVSGVVEAYDQYEALAKIKENGAIVDFIAEVPSLADTGKDILGKKQIPDKTLSIVSSQFANILKSGLPIVHTVRLIGEQTGDKKLKALLESVEKDIASGHGLAQSLESKGKDLLPLTFIETVRAGGGIRNSLCVF